MNTETKITGIICLTIVICVALISSCAQNVGLL